MKKISIFAISIFCCLAFIACSTNNRQLQAIESAPSSDSQQEAIQETPSETENQVEESIAEETDDAAQSKILIAYFSRVGNTDFDSNVDVITSASLQLDGSDFVGNCEIVANMIAQQTSGDVYLIETVEKYPSNYRSTTDLASTEQANDARPTLATTVDNMEAYDIVFVVYPNWWGTLPQPVFTFLESYDFSEKIILPIATHEGSGLGRGPSDIASLCPDATLLRGLAIRGSSSANAASDIRTWIENSGVLKE